ncbi:MAG: class I SAM-dependent methyltransferase [Patescibacteria group bacterium]
MSIGEDFENKNRRLFNFWAKFYDFIGIRKIYFEPLYVEILDALKREVKKYLVGEYRFLDIACGTGEIISRLAKEFPNPRFVGADFSIDMVKKAKEKNANLKNAEFYGTNASKLPFDDESFDVVLCSEAFHHFLMPERVLEEARRVLKPRGYFLLVDPAFNNACWRGFARTIFKPIESAKDYYSAGDLQRMLLNHGFQAFSSFKRCLNNFVFAKKV